MNVEHPSLKSRPAYSSHAGVASMAVVCLLVPLSPSYANEVPAKPSESSGTTVQRPPGVVVGTPAPSRDESSGDKDTRPRMTLGRMRAEPKPVPVPGRSRIEAYSRLMDGSGVDPDDALEDVRQLILEHIGQRQKMQRKHAQGQWEFLRELSFEYGDIA